MEIGFLGLLQIVFIVLKVLNKISWSWWMVFIPLYIEIALIIAIIAFYVIRHKIRQKKKIEWQKRQNWLKEYKKVMGIKEK